MKPAVSHPNLIAMIITNARPDASVRHCPALPRSSATQKWTNVKPPIGAATGVLSGSGAFAGHALSQCSLTAAGTGLGLWRTGEGPYLAVSSLFSSTHQRTRDSGYLPWLARSRSATLICWKENAIDPSALAVPTR